MAEKITVTIRMKDGSKSTKDFTDRREAIRHVERAAQATAKPIGLAEYDVDERGNVKSVYEEIRK